MRRILLQIPLDAGVLEGSDLSPPPINGSSETPTIRGNPMQPMALAILVLLIALLFISFFFIYIRRSPQEYSTTEVRLRRDPSRPPGLHDNNRKSCGADAAVIKSLPLVSYGGGAKQLTTECPICLSEFEEGEMVKLIPYCRHVFHPECIDMWLASHVSCPLCRSTQLFKVADDKVRFDVNEEDNGNVVSELGGRSTVDDSTRGGI